MHTIVKVISDWFTGIDGQTYDPARFLWFFGIIAFLTFTAVDIYRHDKFDMENFAFAYASLLAAGAAGVKIKETTEPLIAAPTTPIVPEIKPGQVIMPVSTSTVAPTPAPVSTSVQSIAIAITDDDIPKPPKG